MLLSKCEEKNEVLIKRGFTPSDVRFLCRRTSLRDEAKMLSLIEEDEDLGLIMNQIADLPLVKKQTTRLSLNFLLLLLIHKYSGDSIRNEHKQIIAKISSDYFCLIIGSNAVSANVDFTRPPDENTAKLIFVLNGIFGEYFSQFFEGDGKYSQIKRSHTHYITKGLDRYDASEWVEEGLATMKKIAESGWLNRFTKKIKK